MTNDIDDKKYKVLIVDDEDTNLMVLRYILESEYDVLTSKSGRGAINAAFTFLPDIILLDIVMPEVDGFEVLETLKNDDRTKDIPVIFVTGVRDENKQIKSKEMGAADYIIKPFSTPTVEEKVRNQLLKKIVNR